MFDRSHFSSIEAFFGYQWLEDGAQRVKQAVLDMFQSGYVTADIERREHPLHQLWYKYVLGGTLPSDWIRSQEGKVDQMLRQTHRILTLEYLINSLASEWDDKIVDDVRVKLMNTDQFSSALYELEVVDNFKKSGIGVSLRAPGSVPSADIEGHINGVHCFIECKRVEFKADAYRERQQIFKNVTEAVLTKIKAISGSIVVSIEFSSLPTDSDLQAVLDRVRSSFVVPRKSTLHHVPRIATIQVTLLPLGAVWLHTHSEYFDLFFCIGEFSPDGSAQGNIRIVGIRDQVPFDWSERVRRSLNSARHQLPKTSCNMVCIEVADLAYSRMPQELACVREGIDSFLRNDTRRVSGVILSISGMIQEGLRQYRSAGSAWLHVHENPYVPLPQSFVMPSFDQPRVSVRADIQRQAQE